MSFNSQFQLFILIVTIPLLAVFVTWMSFKQDGKTIQSLEQQLAFIKAYVFPKGNIDQIKLRYPHFSIENIHAAFEQLRLYFMVYRTHNPRMLAMPSKLVDDCWHVFICDTREYQLFCQAAFGGFLHHEAQVQIAEESEVDAAQDSVRAREARAQLLAGAQIYQWAAAMTQALSTQGPVPFETFEASETAVASLASAPPSDGGWQHAAVPMLFAIDSALQIKDGYIYPTDYLLKLSGLDIKAAEASSLDNSPSSGSVALGCGDGGAASCGGCGGST